MSLIDSETRREVGKTDLAAARPRSDTRAGSPRQAGDRFKAGALVMAAAGGIAWKIRGTHG